MTLVVSQSGTFTGYANPTATMTPTPGTSPVGLVVMASVSMNAPSYVRYGGVDADAIHTAYGGISKTNVLIAYWLDITGRIGDSMVIAESHGGATQVGWCLIEADDLRFMQGSAFASGGSYTTPTKSPTVAGGNVASFVNGAKYSGGYSAGANCTAVYDTRTDSRDAFGGYGVGGTDEAWSVTMAGGASTGGWEASGYVILEEQSVVVPKPSQAIIIAS